MHQKIYSYLVIVGTIVSLYLYSTIYFSSLRLENNKYLISSIDQEEKLSHLPDLLNLTKLDESWLNKHFVQNPDEIEQLLRYELLTGNSKKEQLLEMRRMYRLLQEGRPSWPYYYSGLSQIDNLLRETNNENLKLAISFGSHESLVVESMAEILFYKWDLLDKKMKNDMLGYLIKQSDIMKGRIVNISAKYSRIYEYCDYIYDKKHVEYAACKGHYWQPLMKL